MASRRSSKNAVTVSASSPGIIKAIELCFPRAARQRCLAHRMRNLAAKLPEDVWPEFKVRAQATYHAPSRAIAATWQPASSPIMAARMIVRLRASWMTSKPVLRTYDSR
jgi:transposase-like protein